MEGCPVGIDIPRFIKNIERGEFLEAAKNIERNKCAPRSLRSGFAPKENSANQNVFI